MKVHKTPDELRVLIKKYTLDRPGCCYTNSFGLVIQTRGRKSQACYVLVNITNDRGEEHPHAIINYDGKFYDPTYEKLGYVDRTKYTFIKQFSIQEIDGILERKFSQQQIEDMRKGREAYWPLVQIGENDFDFVDEDYPVIEIKSPSLKSYITSLFNFAKIR